MKKILLVFGVSTVLVVLLASTALAQNYGKKYGGGAMNASPTATASATASPTASAPATASPSAGATATATASPLPTTGGPPLVGPLTWMATLALIGSGVGALVLLRGGGAVS